MAAPAARLFAPVFNYKAAYDTATEEAGRLREEVAELRESCALLRQGRDLAVVAAEAAAARCVELETELTESHGAWQRKLDGFQLTLDTVTASSQRWHLEFQVRVDEEVKRVVESGKKGKRAVRDKAVQTAGPKGNRKCGTQTDISRVQAPLKRPTYTDVATQAES